MPIRIHDVRPWVVRQLAFLRIEVFLAYIAQGFIISDDVVARRQIRRHKRFSVEHAPVQMGILVDMYIDGALRIVVNIFAKRQVVGAVGDGSSFNFVIAGKEDDVFVQAWI